MDAEAEIRWCVDGHVFVAVAALNDGTLTLRLQMPAAFLAGASDQQRRAYARQREDALLELASALAQREGEDHHHPTHHH